MNPYIGLFFDIVILIALGATMIYAWRLSQQFDRMQADRRAFDQLIASLNLAASRAEAVIRSLKEAAISGSDTLQEKIAQGRALTDELEIMIQAGDNLAERLNKVAESSRRSVGAGNAASHEETDKPLTATRTPDALQPRTKAEKELLEALKAKQSS